MATEKETKERRQETGRRGETDQTFLSEQPKMTDGTAYRQTDEKERKREIGSGRGEADQNFLSKQPKRRKTSRNDRRDSVQTEQGDRWKRRGKLRNKWQTCMDPVRRICCLSLFLAGGELGVWLLEGQPRFLSPLRGTDTARKDGSREGEAKLRKLVLNDEEGKKEKGETDGKYWGQNVEQCGNDGGRKKRRKETRNMGHIGRWAVWKRWGKKEKGEITGNMGDSTLSSVATMKAGKEKG
jgi:hypothetical protein